MPALLERLSRYPLRHPGRTVAAALLVLVASGISLANLELKLDVTEMLPTPAARTLTRVAEVFGINERAYVLIEAEEPGREEDLRQFARGLGERLAHDARVAKVEWALPVSREQVVDRLLVPYGLLYQDPAELEALLTPAGLRAQLDTTISRLSLMGIGEADAWAERDPLDLNRALARRASTLRGGMEVAEGSEEFLSPDRRALLVAVEGSYGGAASLGDARGLVRSIEQAKDGLLHESSARGLTVSGTGGPYLSEESERVIMQDVQLSFAASIVIALALLAAGLRLRVGTVVLLLVPTLWGTFVGAGLFALLRPSLAVLSLGCSAILIGLGVDFTVHLTAHALGARAAGLPGREAVYEAVRVSRGALALAAFSSAAAFAAFMTSGTQILRDMGLLTACGLAACLVGALGILPVILSGRGVTGRPDPLAPHDFGVMHVARFATRRPLRVLGAAALVSLLAVLALVERPPGLESDLRRLQARDSPVIATQDRVETHFGSSSDGLVVVLSGDDQDAVVNACQELEPTLNALRAEGSLIARSSVAGLLPPRVEQARCLELLRARGSAGLRADLTAALEDAGFDPTALAAYVGAVASAAELDGPLTVERMGELGLGPLVQRFVRRGPTGQAHALIQLTPAPGLGTGAGEEAFLGRLRAGIRGTGAHGEIAGLALVSRESSELVSRDFAQVALWTVLAVVGGLLLRFRHPGRVLLVLLPAALGTLWTAGVFAFAGWKLNLMNLGVLPMVLAIGVDDGIHVMHHVLQRTGPLLHALRGTAVGVLLTSLTTMVTFGSLALSDNLGIASVGLLCFLGIGSCLLATIAVLPAVLTLRGIDP